MDNFDSEYVEEDSYFDADNFMSSSSFGNEEVIDDLYTYEEVVHRSIAVIPEHHACNQQEVELTKENTPQPPPIDYSETQIFPPLSFGSESVGSKESPTSFEHVVAPPLPRFPFMLEQSHFRCDGPVSAVATSVDKLVHKYDRECTFSEQKCKWKVLYCVPRNDDIKFIVRLFSKNEQTIVEVQRRMGDSRQFQNIFNEIRTAVKECQTSLTRTVPAGELVVLPLPKFPYSLESNSHFSYTGEALHLSQKITSCLVSYPTSELKFIPEKSKWKVALNIRGSYVKFIIRMFAQDESYIVEVQRRLGDSSAFQQVYRDLLQSVNNPKKQQEFSVLDSETKKAACLAGVDMAKELMTVQLCFYSPKEEVRMQAGRTLLDLSQAESFQKAVRESPESLLQFVKLLEEPRKISKTVLKSISLLLGCQEIKAKFLEDAEVFQLLLCNCTALLKKNDDFSVCQLCATIVYELITMIPTTEVSKYTQSMKVFCAHLKGTKVFNALENEQLGSFCSLFDLCLNL